MIEVDVWDFITILIFSFALFLLITGAFTAYFGSGKSRKIGAGLLAGGLIIGIIWAYLAWQHKNIIAVDDLGNLILGSILVLVAAIIGAVLAIGLFLLTIMKS
jgi:hypothetical protein